MKVGDRIRFAYIWAHDGDYGDGEIEGIGDDWVIIRETFYDNLITYHGPVSNLEPYLMEESENECTD